MQRNVNNVALSCDTWSEFKTYEYSHPLISFLPFSLLFSSVLLTSEKKNKRKKKEKERNESTDVI